MEAEHGTVLYWCNLRKLKTQGSWYLETHLKQEHGMLDKQEYNLYPDSKETEPNNKWNSSNVNEEVKNYLHEDADPNNYEERRVEHGHNRPN